MVVDSSALVAILLGEDERPLFEDIILRQPVAVTSVVSVLETTIVLLAKRRDPDADRIDEILSTLRIDVRGVDLEQGTLACNAFRRYGRGRGVAKLNFGDCFVYALAKMRDDPLLFKGGDFMQTDIVPAWQP
jgi:ribonuclease VapC